ncbi:MAG: hypothetical protein J2P48_06905 [Alphaproteobacteria bacterium]|nr:hypothetical protein [Alphaproteobacteria bacterium]
MNLDDDLRLIREQFVAIRDHFDSIVRILDARAERVEKGRRLREQRRLERARHRQLREEGDEEGGRWERW